MGEYKTSPLDQLFGAIADPTRRAILDRLARGEARVTEIAADFPISLNSVSKHLRMLERAGLVVRRVQGRDHYLSVNAEPLDAAAQWIDHHRQFWEQSLAALEQFVMRKPRTTEKTRKRSSRP
jgi:DNA-binding transcriptional ArsR family regulator